MAIWHGLSGLTWIWLHPTTTLHLPRPSGSLGVLGGAWGSLWPCLWQSRGKNKKKVYLGQKGRNRQKVHLGNSRGTKPPQPMPQITQGAPWGVLQTHHTTRRLQNTPLCLIMGFQVS